MIEKNGIGCEKNTPKSLRSIANYVILQLCFKIA